MLHEKLLQAFVRIVYAQLFETVRIKVLKTRDVQNSDGAFNVFFGGAKGRVDFLDDLFESLFKDELCKSVSDLDSLTFGQVADLE